MNERLVIGNASRAAPWWRVLEVHPDTQQVVVEEVHQMQGEPRRLMKTVDLADVFAMRDFFDRITHGKKGASDMRMILGQLHRLRAALGHEKAHERCGIGWVLPGAGSKPMCWHCDPSLSKRRLNVLKDRHAKQREPA